MTDASNEASHLTDLLHQYANGETESLNNVVGIVYHELRNMARAQLRRSKVGQQMETTVLVHEAYEKLISGSTQNYRDRRHFFSIAARAMRQIVVDLYRAEQSRKRGGGALPVTLTASHLLDMDRPDQIFAVHRALETLTTQNAELAELIDLSCFAGLSTEEIAALTDANTRTVQRKLKRAQAWLALYISESAD